MDAKCELESAMIAQLHEFYRALENKFKLQSEVEDEDD